MRNKLEKLNTKSRFYAINNVRGITLTTLVITIVVLLILASVATFTGIEAIENTKRTKFIAELKIMQSYVNQWYEDCKPSVNATEYDKKFATNVQTKFTINGNVAINATSSEPLVSDKVAQAQSSLNNANVEPQYHGNFYILEESQLQALGVEGVSQSVIVSVQDRKVVSYLGLKYKNQMYYTIDSLDGENGIDAIYNVGYENPNKNPPSILVTGRSVYNGETAKGAKYKFTVDVTQGSRYINKGDLYYGKIENGNVGSWNKTEDKSFIVDREGTYKIRYKDAAGNESEEIEYQIKPKTTLISGSNFNKKMKELSGTSSPQVTTANTNITGFKIADVKPSNSVLIDNNKVSTNDSQSPTYMWYDNGTIYLWSEENWIGFNSDSSKMFNNLQKAVNIELSYIMDTSDVSSMENLFHNCLTLAELDVSNFNTSNVTTMSEMFSGSQTRYSNLNTDEDYRMKLTKIIGLTSFDTKKVKNMSKMFYMCTDISSLDLTSFDTSNVTDMNSMFSGEWLDNRIPMNLKEIKGINNFNTSNVETMRTMFALCENIDKIDVSHFDTKKCKNMRNMFLSCRNIKELDLSSFDTQNVEDMLQMFDFCYKLETIYVSSNFVTDQVTISTNMFAHDENIVGGAGTTYNSSNTDKTYARIDDPTNGKQGYFTRKQNV